MKKTGRKSRDTDPLKLHAPNRFVVSRPFMTKRPCDSLTGNDPKLEANIFFGVNLFFALQACVIYIT
jgi:hypothetical protein